MKNLAGQIKSYSGHNSTSLTTLAAALQRLQQAARTNAQTANTAIENVALAEAANQKLSRLVDAVSRSLTDIKAMEGPIERTRQSAGRLDDSLEEMARNIDTIDRKLDAAADRSAHILNITEELIGYVVGCGVETDDTPMIKLAQATAKSISDRFSAALSSGEIAASVLFDRRKDPIPTTNPLQFTTTYLQFVDRVLPSIQEPVLARDEKIMFCAAVDVDGYLPTHNAAYSRPQGPDPVWNTANCRKTTRRRAPCRMRQVCDC